MNVHRLAPTVLEYIRLYCARALRPVGCAFQGQRLRDSNGLGPLESGRLERESTEARGKIWQNRGDPARTNRRQKHPEPQKF